ncbi:MAG: VOC family protein [Pseudomonadota bacterium]
MSTNVSVSIDVPDVEQAINFYNQALNCEVKTKYSDSWAVVTLDNLDIHFLKKDAGTIGANNEQRHFSRHWTPVHLDFSTSDVAAALEIVKTFGGTVEKYESNESADIALCADPFGNGFCLIRE